MATSADYQTLLSSDRERLIYGFPFQHHHHAHWQRAASDSPGGMCRRGVAWTTSRTERDERHSPLWCKQWAQYINVNEALEWNQFLQSSGGITVFRFSHSAFDFAVLNPWFLHPVLWSLGRCCYTEVSDGQLVVLSRWFHWKQKHYKLVAVVVQQPLLWQRFLDQLETHSVPCSEALHPSALDSPTQWLFAIDQSYFQSASDWNLLAGKGGLTHCCPYDAEGHLGEAWHSNQHTQRDTWPSALCIHLTYVPWGFVVQDTLHSR